MKKLFTFVCALCLTATALAQSSWKEGQEITNELSWGNLSFQADPLTDWIYVGEGGNVTLTGGLSEVYDGANCDLYQIIYMPAGMYEVTCQGYYRWGTSWDEDPNQYGKDAWENNAFLRVSTGKYDIESEEFTEDRSFQNPLMPRLFEECYTRLFEDTDTTHNEAGEVVYNAGWDMSDGQYSQNGLGGRWAPCSIPGSLVWFQQGKYSPYNDGQGVKYNTVKFFLLEDGYVKVGVQKLKAKSADSFMATNFRMYYQGEAGEAAQLALALEDLDEIMNKAVAFSETIRDAGYGSLATFLFDATLELDYDQDNLESVQNAVAQMKATYAAYEGYLAKANQLTNLIKAVGDILASTDYKNKADLQAAYDKAVAVAEDGNGEEEMMLDGPEDYGKAYEELSKARTAYIMGQDPVDGAINLSTLITTPFFVDTKYTPQWNASANAYQFPLQELEDTWANIQEQGYSEALGEHPDWIPVANDFKLYQGEEPDNQWIMKSTTWHGGGAIGITMQHGYPALGGWTAEPSGNPELLYQHIADLPNGFYSMSALMCNAGADLSDLQYAYIESTNGTEIKKLSVKGNPWWGGNKEQWRATVWEKLQTGMIEVSDGRVTIGTASDAFYASTGFQLYYYGETPDFDQMIKPQLDAAYAAIENQLTWGGDIKAATAMLAEIQMPIVSYEAYTAAQAKVTEAMAYINNAYNTINAFTALDSYIAMQLNYEDGTDNYLILDPAINYVLTLGDGENDTYKDAIAANAVLASYRDYMTIREKAATYDSEEINGLLSSQASVLKAKYSSVEELEAFMGALQTPINRAIFAELGADKASESNPVEVSALIVNPAFTQGPNTGWTGELLEGGSVGASCNEYGRDMAEIWNQGPFDFYQVIRSLPAGAYEVKLRGLYRDGGDPGSATGGPYYNWWYVAACEMEFWENKNAVLYADNGQAVKTDYIKSICDGQFYEPSFMGFYSIPDAGYTVGNNGQVLFFDELTDEDRQGMIDPETGEIFYDNNIDLNNPAYPYDAKVVDGDETYWYPTSMAGVYHRMKMNPEVWWNSVQIMVEDGSNLRIGIRKDKAIGSDWVICDQFQLFYLGTKVPTDIQTLPATADKEGIIYNLAGQAVGKGYKGVVIKDGKKYLNK